MAVGDRFRSSRARRGDLDGFLKQGIADARKPPIVPNSPDMTDPSHGGSQDVGEPQGVGKGMAPRDRNRR